MFQFFVWKITELIVFFNNTVTRPSIQQLLFGLCSSFAIEGVLCTICCILLLLQFFCVASLRLFRVYEILIFLFPTPYNTDILCVCAEWGLVIAARSCTLERALPFTRSGGRVPGRGQQSDVYLVIVPAYQTRTFTLRVCAPVKLDVICVSDMSCH